MAQRVYLIMSLALGILLAGCMARPATGSGPDLSGASTSPAKAVSKFVPGDYSLESIITAAERHMEALAFSEIAEDELKSIYPLAAALPVEIRGRRAADGMEYLVLASLDGNDIENIPDVRTSLEADAAERAETRGMEYRIMAGGINKYAAVVVAKNGAKDLMTILCNAFTGQYILE